MTSPLHPLVAEGSVIVCCGPGGVGKTTIAAALGIAAAEAGRRVCVVTVDPARRLADALGTDIHPNATHEVDGPWRGRLAAVMLDPGATFDDLVARYAADASQVERIKANRLYQNLIGGLSGTQEYMATERLFELHATGEFDLIVVDTPPSRQALDFLAAPSRLTGFLDNRIFRLLVAPGRVTARAVGVAAHLLLRTVARVAGSEIVDDTLAFFQAFEGMEAGFRERARAVETLLASEGTAFVVVTSARASTIAEADWLANAILRHGSAPAVLVVNRVVPPIVSEPSPPAVPHGAEHSAYAELVATLEDFERLASTEQDLLANLPEALAPTPMVSVPLMGGDVHDVGGLVELARHLRASEVR